MNRAVFLDRDGVINRKAPEGQYVTLWREVHFLPHVAEGIALLKRAGFLVIVISNQRCVAKGLVSDAGVQELHQRMQKELKGKGAAIDAFYYCPHELNEGCECRKPSPGMILKAAEEHQVDLAGSWMVGDSEHDVEAGKRAGCKTAFLQAGPTSAAGAHLTASSLFEAARHIVRVAYVAPVPHSEAAAS
jgi:D-glycero-D-manno-heptose 1,7-bisphosphate phosphatase